MLKTFKTSKSVMIEMIFRQKKHRIKKNIPYALFCLLLKYNEQDINSIHYLKFAQSSLIT